MPPPAAEVGPRLWTAERLEDIGEKIKAAAAEMVDGVAMLPQMSLSDTLSAFELGVPQMDTGANFVPLSKELAKLQPLAAAVELEVVIEELVSAYMSWLQGYLFQQTLLANLRVEALATKILDLKGGESPGLAVPGSYSIAAGGPHQQKLAEEHPKIQAFLVSLANRLQSKSASLDDVLDAFIVGLLHTCHLTLAITEDAGEVIQLEEDFSNDADAFYLLRNTPLSTIESILAAAFLAAQKLGARACLEDMQLLVHWLNSLEAIVHGRATEVEPRVLHESHAKTRFTKVSAAERSEILARVAPFKAGCQSRIRQSCLVRKLADRAEPREAYSQWMRQWQGLSKVYASYDTSRNEHAPLSLCVASAAENYPPLVRASLFLRLIGPSPPICPLPVVIVGGRGSGSRGSSGCPMSEQLKNLTLTLQQQITASWLELLAALCQNRCRQVDNLAQCLPFWTKLANIAVVVDKQSGGRTAFAPWTRAHKHRIRRWLAFSQVALQLAATWELPCVYWFAARECEQACANEAPLAGGIEASKERAVWGALAKAQFLLLTALGPALRGAAPPCAVANDRQQLELVFALRLQPFAMQGDLPVLEDFENAQRGALAAGKLAALAEARAVAKEAQVLAKGDTRLLRSALMIGLAATQALQKADKGQDCEFELQWENAHPMFPCPKACTA